MAATLRQFTEALVASGLMTADELRTFRATLPPRQRHLTAETLAGVLVQEGRLTTYQAGRILAGKPQGLILGNNVILDCIGVGGMGEVFKAEHRRMKRWVAIKILHREGHQSEADIRRFQREVEAAAKLSHPNIVTAFDADEEQGIHFLVMEYVDGESLAAIVNRDGPLEVARALDYIIQAAHGLAYAHSRGVIHRDIKPGNLLVNREGVVKILDMGLACFDLRTPAEGNPARKPADDSSITEVNQIVGTVDYMAPEQADRSAGAERRSDIYSLGCTLYRLLTGSPPYAGTSTIATLVAHRSDPIPSIRAARPDVPECLDRVFERLVAKSPADRYANTEEAIAELQRCRQLLRRRVGSVGPGSRVLAGGTDRTHAAVWGEATAAFQLGEDTNLALGLASPRAGERRSALPVGIDLGTTYSVVAYLDELGRPQTLVNAEGDKTTPSVLLFDDGDVVVGKEALKAMATDMDRVAHCAKRELGWRAFHKPLQGQSYPPEALEAWILNKLRVDAWKTLGRCEQVVITVPAYFDEVRRKATQDAGYMAGFEVIDIINEPTAAAVAFGFQQGYLQPEHDCGPSQKVLVYDLGGGTFDVTVMEIGGTQFATLATDGDVRLGGSDWDQRLVDFVAEEFLRQHGVDPREEPNSLGRLLRDCEEAKRTLSVRSRTHIQCNYLGYSHRVTVTRREFESLTQDLLERTAFTAEQTLRAAGLAWSGIDRVLLVGGSTRMPAVQDMLRRLSGREPDNSVSPDEAVAHGAALHAGFLLERAAGKTPRFQIKNVNSHSLGVAAVDRQTKRKQTAVVIPRNTALPVTGRRVFTTSKDGQRSILVQIVEGESDSPDDCVQIGRFAVRDLPPNLPAQTPVEVRFHYQANGRLLVRVRVVGTERDLQCEIVRENVLSPEELDRWRQRIAGLPPAAWQPEQDSKPTQLMESGAGR